MSPFVALLRFHQCGHNQFADIHGVARYLEWISELTIHIYGLWPAFCSIGCWFPVARFL